VCPQQPRRLRCGATSGGFHRLTRLDDKEQQDALQEKVKKAIHVRSRHRASLINNNHFMFHLMFIPCFLVQEHDLLSGRKNRLQQVHTLRVRRWIWKIMTDLWGLLRASFSFTSRCSLCLNPTEFVAHSL